MNTPKVPTHNLDAEKAVLGAMLLSSEVVDVVADLLSPHDFYATRHQKLFSIMLALRGKGEPVDPLTVTERARASSLLNELSGASYISELTSQLPSLANAEHYARIVLDSSRRRLVLTQCEKLSERMFNPDEDVDAAITVFELATANYGDGQGALALSEYLGPAMADLEARWKGETPQGLPVGISPLDNNAPLAPGDLFVLAGRPGMGKTSLDLKMALGAALEGACVLVVSLEMPALQVTNRLTAMLARIPLESFRTGRLEETDWPKISRANGILSDLPLHIEERPGRTVAQIKAEAARLKRKKGLDLLVIDHLGKIRPDNPGASEYSRTTDAVRGVKDMGRSLGVPVILCTQLNRSVEKRLPPIPSTADLRDSGAIEEEADTIAFIYRQDYYVALGLLVDSKETRSKGIYDFSLEGRCLVRIAKNRHGPTMQFKLKWVAESATFDEV